MSRITCAAKFVRNALVEIPPLHCAVSLALTVAILVGALIAHL